MPSRLIAAIPKLASLSIERSLVFFEGLGFSRKGSYPDYGIIERDGVQIHFWPHATTPASPKKRRAASPSKA